MKKSEKNKSSMDAPQNYEAPVITGLEVEVEKGFAESLQPYDSPVAPPSPSPSRSPWR